MTELPVTMDENYEVGWRVRSGAGLLVHAPVLSDEWRARQRREDEREARQAELEAEQRKERAFEHRWELERQGHTPTSVQERLAAVAAMDRREQKKHEERQALGLPVDDGDYWGKPATAPDGPAAPRLNRWELKANVEARESAKHTTPATQADLDDVQQQVTGLKAKLHALTRRRSDGPAAGGQYFRNTPGGIIGGPY